MKRNPRKQNISSYFPFILIGIGVVLVLGVIVWQITQPVLTGGAGSGSSSTAPISAGGEASYPEIQRIALDQAKSVFDSKEAVFVDVRDAGSYTAGHIPGAINIPLTEIESGTADLSKLKTDQWIITYCT